MKVRVEIGSAFLANANNGLISSVLLLRSRFSIVAANPINVFYIKFKLLHKKFDLFLSRELY